MLQQLRPLQEQVRFGLKFVSPRFLKRFGRFRFALFDGLKLVAHRSTAGLHDSIGDNSLRRMPDCSCLLDVHVRPARL